MVANKNSLSTVLMKLATIYKYDMYLINCRYCVNGPITSKDGPAGKTLCILTDDVVDDVIDHFGQPSVIYFKNVKKAKAAFNTEDEYMQIETSFDEKTKKSISESRDLLMKTFKSIDTWNQFNFTEDQIKALFTNGEIVTLFSDNKDIPEVYVTKDIFPLVTDKNINTLYYAVSKQKHKQDINYLYLSLDSDYFQIYKEIAYIKVK